MFKEEIEDEEISSDVCFCRGQEVQRRGFGIVVLLKRLLCIEQFDFDR